MKIRNLLLLFALLIFMQTNTFAQEDKAEIDSLIALINQQKEEHIFPEFFFGWSYIKPLGEYGEGKIVKRTDGTTEHYRGMELGLSFELGYIYWLNHINFSSDKMKFGFKTVYFNPQFVFKNSYDLKEADFNNSFKVGPTFAYNPFDYFVMEANFFAGPTLFYNGHWQNLNLIFNYGFELSIRFKPVYIGVGVTFGKYKIETSSLKDRFEIPTTRLGITFGFNF